MLSDINENLSSPEYPWAINAWTLAITGVWHHEEIAMQGDIADWKTLPDIDKQAIAGVLKGFTILEQRIGCYWRMLADKWPKADLSAMCTALSAQETIHAAAYNYLSATLGLDEYEAFKACPIAQAKLSQFVDKSSIAQSLATFSGGGECVSLFASFLLLMAYCKAGKFNGLRQILSYSAREESLHAEMAAKLFLEVSAENPDERPAQSWLEAMLESARQSELAFVANAFAEQKALAGLTLEDVDSFIKHRCNLAATMLGYDAIYKDAKPQQWFDLLTSRSSATHNDFFAGARTGSSYATKLSQDFGLALKELSNASACDLSGHCYA